MDEQELTIAMKDHIKADIKFNEKLVNDINSIKVSIGKIEVTLEKNTDSLIEHMKRSDMLEKKLEPVERHVMIVNGLFKLMVVLIGLAGTITGIIYTIKK